MAGRPLDAMALIGLGLRTLSMSPGQIGPIKMMIRSLHVGEVAAFVDRLCGRTDHSLRTRLAAFAAERSIAPEIRAAHRFPKARWKYKLFAVRKIAGCPCPAF